MHDEESGLVQNRYRYLNTLLGRFMAGIPLSMWMG